MKRKLDVYYTLKDANPLYMYITATPKGQLPIMEVDGKMMCESMAMARYVARECSKLFTFTTWCI